MSLGVLATFECVNASARLNITRIPNKHELVMSLENQPPSPQGDRLDREKLTFLWGMDPLPMSDTPAHFLAVGELGSGKPIALRLLMQSVMKYIGLGLDHRALVFDTRGKLNSLTRGMALGCPVHTMNPFDRRGTAWDIAADIASPSAANQMATVLIPKEVGSAQPFFADAARQLLFAVCQSFLTIAPGRWTLRDLLLAMRSRERILSLLARSPATAAIAQSVINDERQGLGILTTLITKLQPFEAIAACWQHAPKLLSLERWVGEESVILLEGAPGFHSSVAPVHQLMFRRLSDLLRSQPDSAGRRTWIFLDDIREAGWLETLPALMQQGCCKGVCVAFGMTEIEGIRNLYGPQAAAVLTDYCTHKTAMRPTDPTTAAWAAQLFGPPLTASGLMSLPPTGPAHDYTAFHHTPRAGTYVAHKSWDWVHAHLPPSADATPDEFLRPESEHHLQDWTDEDYRRLGLDNPLPTGLSTSSE